MDALAPLQFWGLVGGWITCAVLLVFFGLRGRVPIDKGWGGMTMPRFNAFERVVHWLLALSFLVLAVTGLAQLYGAPLLSIVGTKALAIELAAGRPLHNGAAMVFVAALAVTFLMRLAHSIPGWRDAMWVARGGGLFVKGTTPPAWKFNAAQKVLFWLVVLGGAGLAITGLALLFPYRSGLASKVFAILAGLGFKPPTGVSNLTPELEVHYARMWHGVLAIGLVCVVIVHVYMRTIGIQGAFSAMTSGRVDVNLARQQHSLWAARELKRMEDKASGQAGASQRTPAE